MHDIEIVKQMQAHFLCWTVKNIPEIATEIRRGITEIHEGRLYVWLEFDDYAKVSTEQNKAMIGEQWRSLCNHYKTPAQLFILTNN